MDIYIYREREREGEEKRAGKRENNVQQIKMNTKKGRREEGKKKKTLK